MPTYSSALACRNDDPGHRHLEAKPEKAVVELQGAFICAGPLGSAASYLSLAVTCPKLYSKPQFFDDAPSTLVLP